MNRIYYRKSVMHC